jgi:heme exporter protein B
MIAALVARDLRRAAVGGAWLPIAFFLLVLVLLPFALGPDQRLLGRVAGGALWIAALTAALLPLERLVEPDRAAGVLDQFAVRGVADETVAIAKVLAHWLSFGPLLLLVAGLGGLMLGLPPRDLPTQLLALGIGSVGLAALAVAVAALTAGLPRAGAVGGLLLLPLAIPLLIFGAAAGGDRGSGALLLEAAIALLLLAGSPFLAGAAMRAARR